MENKKIKEDISIKSRMQYLNEKEIKIANFILQYCFKDKQETYTNGTILVPMFRVLDALIQKGENYTSNGK